MNNKYEALEQSIIDALLEDFPNALPTHEVTPFEFGRLIGQQEIIRKLQIEYQELIEERGGK